MYLGFSQSETKKWNKSIIWHGREFLKSWKIYKNNKEEIDFLTFHCWRVGRIFSKYILNE